MYQGFRYEFHRHKWSFLFNQLSVIVSIPLIIGSNYVCLTNYEDFSSRIYWYYIYFGSRSMAAALYLVTKKPEDCLRCFNKNQNLRYSMYQYTVSELTAIFVTPGALDCTLQQIGILPNNKSGVQIRRHTELQKSAEYLVP